MLGRSLAPAVLAISAAEFRALCKKEVTLEHARKTIRSLGKRGKLANAVKMSVGIGCRLRRRLR
eukprot:CAMPEP_0170200398 /NCGR_PEP_ID=MMETSP0040_2-20121228/69848_1 /TAXON_ID=641309 /ORGANISM="Lotharella oceanica, Strain CCMP622" /LENGTH=63 /DNA_ID=CAMNT_0010450579 /DNA_START=459 /DNA_END=650 /DNA_ORIENTATION=+